VPELVLGPVQRFVSETEATIWVETDSPCEVEVLGARGGTFHVEGHHYALVVVRGLEPGTVHEYEVRLDGEVAWPPPDYEFPAPTIRAIDTTPRKRIVFGSCRVAVPHHPPFCERKDDNDDGREIDALYALALRMRKLPRDEWPDLLMMLGDQVYVDEDAPRTREYIRNRRDTSKPPYEEVADFEEYTHLYREAWGEPTIRWLFSTVPCSMIFDDHDTHDDWRISQAWLEEMEAEDWWEERIEGALVSYWIYQHLGNLSPAEIERRGLLAEVCELDDAGPLLREEAKDVDGRADGSMWSYRRDVGHVRVVTFDSREGRVLTPGRRAMCDEDEWEWIGRQVGESGYRHLVLADTLPVLMSPAFHHAEAWNEAVCDGAWGERAAEWGEKLRRTLDLEHWGAFNKSFRRMTALLRELATGARREAPRTIVMAAGDVHHAYLAEVGFPKGTNAKSAVYQAVCSPFRNPLDSHEQKMANAGLWRPLEILARALARAAGVPDPEIGWRLVQKPTFDNQFATLEYDGDELTFRIEKTVPGDWQHPEIDTSLERRLA